MMKFPLKFIFSFILCCILFYWLFRPVPILWVLKYLLHSGDAKPKFDAIDSFKHNNFIGNLYFISKDYEVNFNPQIISDKYNNYPTNYEYVPPTPPTSISETDDIIVWVHGGAFVTKYPYLNSFIIKLANKLGKNLYAFDYPTLMTTNQDKVFEYIDELLINKFSQFKSITLMGDSAGAYYILMFLNKYKDNPPINIKNIIYMHPFVGQLNNPIIRQIFNIYMRPTNYPKTKTSKFPTLIINSKQDALFYYTTLDFIKNIGPQSTYVEYDCNMCVHDFEWNYDKIDKTNDVIFKIADFDKST